MRPIFRLLLGLVLLVVLLVAVAFVLPGRVSVARSTSINAPEADVFPYLQSPRKFNKWSPWAKLDPKTIFRFSGPASGKGARMQWKSKHQQVGSGSQEIIAVEPNKFVKVALDFGDDGQAEASYLLEPEGAGTKVTWGFETELGANPVMRWMGLMLDRWIGADYERGLTSLKKLVESGGAS